MKIQKIIKVVSFLLALCLVTAAMPFALVSAEDLEVTADNIDALASSASFTYTFNNTKAGSAEGILTFDFGTLPKENVSSLKYYWVDENGVKLSDYSHIVEFGSAYIPEHNKTATHNSIANAVTGYTFLNSSVIPFGARAILAELAITVGDTTVQKSITSGKYVTVVDGSVVNSASLPGNKIQLTDYTADVGGKELYQLMYFADFHNYYEWKGAADADDEAFKSINYTYISSDGKSGSPQGKAMYAVNKILDNDPKSIGTFDVGDIIDDASGGTGSKKLAERGDYNAVLATYYQAGLMDYFNFFAVGNHDLISAYAAEGNNYFIDMLKKADAANKSLITENSLVTGLADTANSYYYDFYIGKDHYIVLSAPHENPAAFGEEQLAWFEALLAADNANGTRTFIACHESLSGTGVYGGGYLADEAQMKAILDENSDNHKVYFFTGHTHISYLDNIQNVYISKIGNVSYIGLPYICNTSTKYDSQGLQVKVYEDKVVMLGRQLYDDKAYCTDYLPSAMFVAKEDEAAEEIPSIITISNANQLSRIGIDPEMPLDGNYLLTADIDLSSFEKWTPIGYYTGASNINGVDTQFTGTFDGNGHTISNMYCVVDSGIYRFAGLFGSLKDATVKNLCLKDCVSYVYNGNKTSAAGMLAGGTVCTSASPYSTVISNVAVIGGWVKCAKANASNPGAAGGLVGFSQSGVTIKDCFVDTTITAVLNLATDAQSNQLGVGGLVGMAYDAKMTATDCIFAGTLDATKYYGTACTEPTVSLWRQNAFLGFNNRGMSDTKNDNAKNAVLTDCYYIDSVVVNSANLRGADGTAKTAEELSLCDIADLGFEENLWMHNGFTPILKVSGEKAFVTGDINDDGAVNVKDLVRFKNYDAGAKVTVALKAVDFNGSKVLEADDMLSLRKLLLGAE